MDEAMDALPNSDAVFLVSAGDRSAYLAKTSMLRRRLLRILKPAEGCGGRSICVKWLRAWNTGSRPRAWSPCCCTTRWPSAIIRTNIFGW